MCQSNGLLSRFFRAQTQIDEILFERGGKKWSILRPTQFIDGPKDIHIAMHVGPIIALH